MFEYIKHRVEGNLPGTYLFVNVNTSKYYSENQLTKIWDAVRDKVGLAKSIRLYDATRHSFASQFGQQRRAASKRVLVAWSRQHKNDGKYYTHTDVGRLKTDTIHLSLKEATVTNVSPEGKAVL